MEKNDEQSTMPGPAIELDWLDLTDYLAPKSAVEYFTRGGDRYAAGRYADAISDFEKVLALEPDNEPAQCMRDLIARQLR